MSIVLLLFIFFAACNGKKQTKSVSNNISPVQVSDTARYTIIPFHKNMIYAIGKVDSLTAATLTEPEVGETELLLSKAVEDYNKKMNNQYQKIGALVKYRLQLVPFVNEKGEKIVFVNCFCSDSNWDENWRKNLVMVDDGGSCFFNIKINLSAKNTFELYVNGEA